MTDVTSSSAQIGAAVHQSRAMSRSGVLERAFSRLFHGLVYAQIWEDPVADMDAISIQHTDRMVCISSGGCNVMSYLTAGPAEITAVDLSPAHTALLRLKVCAAGVLDHDDFFDLFGRADLASNVDLFDQRLARHLDPTTRDWWEDRVFGWRRIGMLTKGLYRFGVLGRFIRAVHLVGRLARVDFRPLLDAPTLDAQRMFFETKVAPLFENKVIKLLARQRAALFGLGIPPAQYDKLAADGGGDVLPVLKERTRKLMCDFPARENYFLSQAVSLRYNGCRNGAVPPYLDVANYNAIQAHARKVTAVNRSLTDVLSEMPEASRDIYVLLDAQDWMTDEQLNALWDQIDRTAAPGARVLFRTGGAADILPGRLQPAILDNWLYDEEASKRAFRDDRSAIYGGVHLYLRRG